MITDSVSETLIVYMYLVICCVKFLELAINEISLRHSWWKLTVDPLFFLTLTTIFFQKMDYFCATSLVMFSFFTCMLRLVILSIVLDSTSILKSVMILPINPIGLQEQWKKSNEIFKIL